MLTLLLAQLPASLAGPADPDYHGKVPERARFAHPDAALSISRLEQSGGLVYTDIFRGAQGQLAAKRAKPALTKAVSLSAHGYGLAVDLDVDAVLRKRGWQYPRLLQEMSAEGWFCHRRDGRRGPEDWHFNHLGDRALQLLPKADPVRRGTWDDPVEARIQELYGAALAPSDAEAQAMLRGLGMGVRAFQEAWALDADGVLGPRTKRALAYVTAELDVRGLF